MIEMKTLTINDTTFDITDDGTVRFDSEQNLTDSQKEQARANIGVDTYVAEEIVKRGQIVPEMAESINWLKENGDTSKIYVLADKNDPGYGYVYEYKLTEIEVESGGGYTNLIDGTNGYIKKGYRYSASSQVWKEVTGSDTVAAIVIPVPTSGSLTIRVRGMKYNAGYPSIYGGTTNAKFSDNLAAYTTDTYEENGDWIFTFSNTAGASYIVTTGLLTGDVSNVIVTVNEEIVEGGTEIIIDYAWVNTGIAFISAYYEDRIIDLENKVASLENVDTIKPSYTNLLPLAVQSDGKTPYVGANGEKGYNSNVRVSSSGTEKSEDGYYATGFIPVRHGQTVRVKGVSGNDDSGYCVVYFGNQADTPWVTASSVSPIYGFMEITPDENNVRTFIVADQYALYMRLTLKGNPDEFVITIDEEIKEPAGSTDSTNQNSLETIKNWDAPIYDANIPVFELSAEKTAMTNATNTPDAIYAKYDALMAKHPRYITKTDLGLCSDGVNHVYRYDFREPEPLHESNKVWSETKTKAIIVTGIHFEWAGIYAMFNALEEIAENPNLRHFRRNTHLIVVPVANPYATIANNYQSGLSTPNSYGVRNANGVEIHRNFEVDWVLTEEGSTHYGGVAPLSEVETQYIDNILKNNKDAALFLSGHNCGVENVIWGTGFIWASTATKYMCNMGYRLIDKLSDAWMDKYGDILSGGIEEYKTSTLADGETRLGWTGISTSPGTEAKQATKYGIQGTNVEICDPFRIHGTKANPEPSMSAFTMSRGAEVYVNFLLTTFGVYDPKDKALYG